MSATVGVPVNQSLFPDGDVTPCDVLSTAADSVSAPSGITTPNFSGSLYLSAMEPRLKRIAPSFESKRNSAPDGSGQHVPMLIATVPPRSQVVFTVYLRVLPTPPSSHTLNVPTPSLMNVLVVPSNDFCTAKVSLF